MFRRVLIGFDGSPESGAALRLAAQLACPDATLVVVHVETDDAAGAATVLRDARLESARALLADRPGVEYVLSDGPDVAAALHHVACDTASDLIVVGSSRRRGAGRALLGSNTEATLQGAPCAVAVSVPDGPDVLGRIGVAFNGTDDGRRTVRGAGALARELGAVLTILAVVDTRHAPAGGTLPEPGDVRERIVRRLAAVAAEQTAVGRVHRQLHRGDPVHETLGLGRESDLLVVGTRAGKTAQRPGRGGITSEITRRATCPVLVLPGDAPVPGEPRAVTMPAVAAPSVAQATAPPAPRFVAHPERVYGSGSAH